MTFAALQTLCLLTMFPIEPKIGRKDPLLFSKSQVPNNSLGLSMWAWTTE